MRASTPEQPKISLIDKGNSKDILTKGNQSFEYRKGGLVGNMPMNKTKAEAVKNTRNLDFNR